MSYIAFDLDAFDAAESAARHAGASADAVMAGLLRLWRHCWRQKTDRLTADQLRGVFGMDAAPALVAFGFLETVGEAFRVKGAERYLRIQEGRSKGGKAASGNLKQNQKQPTDTPGTPPADVRLATGSPPADDRHAHRLDSGLSPTSEQRLANSEQRKTTPPAKKPREPKPADPRLGPLVGRLKASYREIVGEEYQFSDNDGAALKALLPVATDDEIDRRFRIGLSADQYSPKCSTVFQLKARWNDLAVVRGTAPKVRDKPTEYTTGAVTL